MAWPALTQDSDLAGFQGAPYPDPVIRAAELSVRQDAGGWHISPVITEVHDIECCNPWRLVLPSLLVVSIASIVDDIDSTTVTAFRLRPYGIVFPPIGSWWKRGHTYTVTMTHGFASVPDLVPVVAKRCQRMLIDDSITQRSETVGQRTSSESYNAGRIDLGESAISNYRLAPF